MNHLKANILGLALLCCLPMGAQIKWNQAYQTYINQYKDLAIEQMLRYRIPASITLAQGLFESAAGRSDLVRQGNNHFGIISSMSSSSGVLSDLSANAFPAVFTMTFIIIL